MNRDIPLYERLADTIREEIERGVYRRGDRIPSVRRQSLIRGVSVNTVKTAYHLLERQALLKAIPQVGYTVLPRDPGSLVKPETPKFSVHPSTASVSDLWRQVHLDAENPELCQLGIMTLDRELLPASRLARTLRSAVRLFPGKSISEDSLTGEESLRRLLARRYSEFGCSIGPDELFITSGCTEGLLLALIALTKPGDSIVVEQPFFTSALQMWESLGLRIIEVPADPVSGVIMEDFEKAILTGGVKACVLVANYGNPLGSLLPDEKKERIARLCSRHDIPVIEDDIFGDLFYASRRPKPLKGFDTAGNVIMISSFSKTIAPGYRVGWIAPGKYRERMERLMLAFGSRAARASQLALSVFMAEGDYDRHLRAVRRVYAARRDAVADAVERWFPAGTRMALPEGGLMLWVQLPDEYDTMKLYFPARGEGIAIMPGALFTLQDRFRHSLRLNFARWDDQREKALRRLGEILEAGEACSR